MHPNIIKIQKNIEPLRQQIIHHKVYAAINQIEDLQIFMEHHIYAVWDFMSLLKYLQINLTCTSLPWFPVGDGVTRQLINEIVAGEESDIDAEGNIKSHFELYLEAMKQSGANVEPIHNFLLSLKQGMDLATAFEFNAVPKAARNFVSSTFNTISSDKVHLCAASFTFGREDLIPNMFLSMVNDLNSVQPEKVSTFKYYLDRHIEIDGDHHSHLALAMTEKLCDKNQDFWLEAEETAKQALQNRIDLWDSVYSQIVNHKAAAV